MAEGEQEASVRVKADTFGAESSGRVAKGTDGIEAGSS